MIDSRGNFKENINRRRRNKVLKMREEKIAKIKGRLNSIQTKLKDTMCSICYDIEHKCGTKCCNTKYCLSVFQPG